MEGGKASEGGRRWREGKGKEEKVEGGNGVEASGGGGRREVEVQLKLRSVTERLALARAPEIIRAPSGPMLFTMQ